MQTLRKNLKRVKSLKPATNTPISLSKSFERIHIETVSHADSEGNCTSYSGSIDSSPRSSSPNHVEEGELADWPATHPDIMQHITERDEALFGIVRSRVTELSPDCPYNTEFNLKRWLMAFNYDLDKIVPKLKLHMYYRSALGLDQACDQNGFMDPLMSRYYPGCNMDAMMKAKDDSLIQVLLLGKLDVKGVMLSTAASAIVTSRIVYVEQCLQKIMQIEQKSGRRTGITWVLDLEGLKYDTWTFAAANGPFKVFVEFLLANYVEISKRILIINAGKLLYAVWRLLQPMVPQKTKDKIHIFDSNWKLQIRHFIDPNSLPKKWGGNINNDDFERRLVIPTKVPEDYFYKPALNEPPEMILEHRHLTRQAYVLEEFFIPNQNSCLQWYFKTDGEVSFGIFFSRQRYPKCNIRSAKGNLLMDKDPNLEMVYPLLTLWSTPIPEQGGFACPKVGWYYVCFGNPGRMFARNIKFQIIIDSSTMSNWNSFRLNDSLQDPIPFQ